MKSMVICLRIHLSVLCTLDYTRVDLYRVTFDCSVQVKYCVCLLFGTVIATLQSF